jgi:hypothetical protein
MLSDKRSSNAWVSLFDPMQVFEDDDYRLIQAFTNDDALDCVERPSALDLRVHLSQRVGAFLYSQQPQQVRQSVAELWVKRGQRGPDPVAPGCRIIRVPKAKIAAQQFKHRQPCRRLAVRHRVGFEQLAFCRQCRFELVEQPRLPGPGLGQRPR